MSEGRIVKGIAGFYYVHDGVNLFECKAKGILRNQKEKPLVGDLVTFDTVSLTDKTGNITGILPRKSEFIRPAVANIDEILLVFSGSVPSPNFEMLNRYLASVSDYEVPVRLVVTKADLCDKNVFSEISENFKNIGSPIHFVSSKTGEGMEELSEALTGKISVLAGPSGVGKSSLINGLFGRDLMEVGELSRKIERGKNTTRHAELFFLRENTYILDTPGFTSVDFDSVSPENLGLCFPEFLPHLVHCKFSSCTHMREPGCAVRNAVESGAIAAIRYKSYVNMYTHLNSLRRYS